MAGKINKGNRKEDQPRERNYGKISVIIPVYNAEDFIAQCIRSVTSQTYSDLEIIVVDDGSADQSLKICEELSRYDSRIKLFSQKNAGVSSARNRGLDAAEGRYVFFLDSDDAIHPLLFAELVCQAEEHQAEMALCEYVRLEPEDMQKRLKEASKEDERPTWQIIGKTESEEWFHIKYSSALMRVGTLILRKLIGSLRFDTNMFYGEDTLFMYHLVCRQVRLAYSSEEWYYYRMHPESITHSLEKIKDGRYFASYRVMRDGEYQRGHRSFALIWERRLVWALRQKYTLMKEKRDKEGCCILKKQAASEMRYYMFRELPISAKALLLCCFYFYPLYFVLKKPLKGLDKIVWRYKERAGLQ